MRINSVKKSRDDQGRCGKCSEALPAGSAYRWIKGRYGPRKVRCMKPECSFRPSEMTESKMADVYGAQESVEDFMIEWSPGAGVGDVQSACSDAAEAIRSVAEEYREAAEAMGGAGSEMEDKASELESWSDDVENAANDFEDFEPSYEAAIECPKCRDGGAKNAETAELQEPVGGVPESEGKYACRVCAHTFTLDECDVVTADGQTMDEWADEVRSAVQDAIDSCPV